MKFNIYNSMKYHSDVSYVYQIDVIDILRWDLFELSIND